MIHRFLKFAKLLDANEQKVYKTFLDFLKILKKGAALDALTQRIVRLIEFD